MSNSVTLLQLPEVLRSPSAQWAGLLAAGLALAPGIVVPIAAQSRASGLVAVYSTGAAVALRVADLAALLDEELRQALVPPELGSIDQLQLGSMELLVDPDAGSFASARIVLRYPLDWDIGAAWLGQPGYFVVSELTATVDLLSPLTANMYGAATLSGTVQLGGGVSLRLGASLPELDLFGIVDSQVRLRALLKLFGLSVLPAGLEDVGLTRLTVNYCPRTREGVVSARISDVFHVTLNGRSYAVDELFIKASYLYGMGVSAWFEGTLTLAGLPLTLQASFSPEDGWSFLGAIAGAQQSSGVRSVRLLPLLKEILAQDTLPPEVPDIEFSDLSLAFTPATGELMLGCVAQVELSLAGSEITIRKAALQIERLATGSLQVALALVCTADIADTLQIEESQLTFNLNTGSRVWSLSGGFKATLFNRQPALDLQASLKQGPSGTQLSFTAEGAEVGFDLVAQPPVRAYLEFRSFTLDRQQAGTELRVAVRARLTGLPAPLDSYLPQQLNLVGSFARGTLSLALEATFGLDIVLPAIEVAGHRLALGTMRLELSEIGLQVGRAPGLNATVGIGLPSQLNQIFGTDAQGAASMEIFRTYLPPQPAASGTPGAATGLLRLTLQLGADGLSAQLLDPPLKCATASAQQWSLELGEFGAVSLTVPTLSTSGGGLSGSGAIHVDPQRGLHLPLTPVRALFEMAGLGEAAAALPRSIRLDRIQLLDANGEVDLAGLLGVPHDSLPADLRAGLAALGQITRRLPAQLRSYLAWSIGSLSFRINTDASGSIGLEVATSPDAPLRCLLPGFPLITGVQLRRLSFGPILGGSLFKLDIDADIDVFDLATIIMAEVMPDSWFGDEADRPLPARAAMQRTLHLQNLLAIIVYQAGIPIPLPLLYTKLGYSYVGIEGFASELHLYCHSPSASTTGGFRFDMSEALGLLTSLKSFFLERDYLLSQQPAPASLNLIYRVDKAYLKLPRYLGGTQLGSTQPIEVANLYKALAGTLDAVKTGSPSYLVKAAPIEQRVGRVVVKLLDTSAEVDWVLVTRDELSTTSAPVAALLAARDGHAGVTTGEVQALMPSPNAIAGSLAPAAGVSADDLLCAMRGSFTMGSVLGLDSLLVMRASPAGGFATALWLRGQIADLVALQLRGVLQIAPQGGQPLLLAGTSQLAIADRTVMYGGFAITNDRFQIEGLLDLFPPGAPVAVRGRLAGGIDKDRFWLSGQGELALMSIPLVGAQLELSRDGSQYALQVGTTLLGASTSFTLRAQPGKLVGAGTMSPIRIGSLLTIARSRGNYTEGPLLLLEHTESPSATRFELRGYASLLGMADLETTVVIGPEGTRFRVNNSSLGGAIQTDFDCLLPAAGGLRVTAAFALNVSGQHTVSRTLPNGDIQQELSPQLHHDISGSLTLMALPPSAPESMIAPWRTLEAQQQVLFAPSGPLRNAGAAAAQLAALEEKLWQVHELHLALTAPSSNERLPIARLDRYIVATQAAISAAEALGTELAGLAQAQPAEGPTWHELRSCLGAVRAAAQRGLGVATALQVQEGELQGQLDALVERLMANVGSDSALGLLAAAQELRDLVAARDLYPEDPRSGGAGCAALADARTADYLAELDRTLAATSLRAQARASIQVQHAALAQQAYTAARGRIPASESVGYRLPNLEAAADAYGQALGRVQERYGSQELARALAAHGSSQAAAAVADLAARDGALTACVEDLAWVLANVDHFPPAERVGADLRQLSDALIEHRYMLMHGRLDPALSGAVTQAERLVANLLPGFALAEVLQPLRLAAMLQGDARAMQDFGRSDFIDQTATIGLRIAQASSEFLAERDRRPDRAQAGARLLVQDFVSQRVEYQRLITLGAPVPAGADRQLLRDLLARRPLAAGALPFLGLTLPVDGAPGRAVPAPLAPASQDLAISLAMQLSFSDGVHVHDLASVHIDGPSAGRLSDVPGLIAAEVGARLLGISNENLWLDRRLSRHARARLLRRQRIAEHDWAMERYHGIASRV